MQPKTSPINEAPPSRSSSEPMRNPGHESEIRQWTFKKCQENHLSSSLFPLQSVLIPPKLIAKIQTPGPEDARQYMPVLYQALPKVFDAPELLTGMPYPTISLEKALSGNGRIIVSGYAGTGKTTLLADLASRICSKDPSLGSLTESLPIFIHCRDLSLSIPSSGDVFTPLAHSVAVLLRHHDERHIYDALSANAQQGSLILFLDGLEEVLPDFSAQVIHWIQNLLKTHPDIKLITTAMPNYIGQLEELGFFELSVAPWTRTDKNEFITKFTNAWKNCYKQPEGASFIPLWLKSTNLPAGPLEMTLLCWTAFTGNPLSKDGVAIFIPYLENLTRHPLALETLTAIAAKQIADGFAGLSQAEIEIIIDKDPIFTKDQPEKLPAAPNAESKGAVLQTAAVTPRSVAVELIRSGLLTRSITGRIHFTQSYLWAALYAHDPNFKVPNSWHPAIQSSLIDSMLVFACAEGKLDDQITRWSSEDTDVPLFRNLLAISHWLTAFPQRNKSKLVAVYRQLIPLIQKTRLPLSLQIRLSEAFLLGAEPPAVSLFKNLAFSSEITHRQTAAFGLSFFNTAESEKLLCDLTSDSNTDVQKLACISLAKSWTPTAQKQLVSLVISASPEIRQIICELFAFVPPDGHELLKEISVLPNNPESRKAAIYGLFLINSDWSKAQIKKVNIDDSEWLVRDAAAHTIKLGSTDYLLQPRRKAIPSALPWLIKFAAAKHMGVHSDEFPADSLMLAVQEGDPVIQNSALELLSLDTSAPTLHFIRDIFQKTQGSLQETAYLALHSLGKRGINILK